ncbi:hypothetical protein VN12_05255 [Pirellula sp. SH-Sr6A]|uniref:M17 family peptidase N-terminal domain-containing protein n=1 Tax=Pirellula sp. SH-Sr6A TaxID=1632865 RepID=UPI00078C8A6A|nr:M17 family peptidase N-terminal domain-containing protein [Pirellula sp. SH-Sr6A]AMV31504.1 hypothetical protein VN12_05255 [Pirellula sp. SH-Sr6A]
MDSPSGLPIVVRMQGPYDADVPLQIVCYFMETPNAKSKLFGAPVELDTRLGGIITSLRQRVEFKGDALETMLLEPPVGSIKPKKLLLIGLGGEADLTLDRMEAVGRTALREAVRIGATQVAFAPLIKDAGNDSLPAGDVENAVIRGVLLAYDTQVRLHNQGFAPELKLNTWIVEAGPTYYEETIAGVKQALKESQQLIDQRATGAYSTLSK